MYSKSDITGKGEHSYIPTNYRGNALYFERMSEEASCEDDTPEKSECHVPPCDAKCSHKHEQDREHTHAHNREEPRCKACADLSHSDRCEHRPAAPSFLSSLFGSFKSDSMLIILIVLFFVLSGKDKEGSCSDDNTMLLLLLILLL